MVIKTKLLLILFILSIFIFLCEINAEEKETLSSEEKAQVIELLRDAKEFFFKKNFIYSIELLKKAFSILPDPNILFNIARAYEEAKNYEDALYYYKEFLKMSSCRDGRKKAEEKIKILEEQMHGNLFLEVNCKGAQVFIDEEYKGLTPLLSPLKIRTGSHKLKIVHEEYETLEKEIFILPQTKTSLKITMIKKTSGDLIVSVNVDGANVFIDNKKVGVSPLMEPLKISDGEHEIEVSKTGYKTKKIIFEILVGESKKIDVQLEREISIPKISKKRASWEKTLSLVTLGSGVIFAGAGGVINFIAEKDKNIVRNAKIEEDGLIHSITQRDAKYYENIANLKMKLSAVFYGIAGVSFLSSIIFFIIDKDTNSEISILPEKSGFGIALKIRK